MPYYIDFDTLDLGYLKKRLLEEDLIPSQLPLRDNIDNHCHALTTSGITTLSRLGKVLQKDTDIKNLSEQTKVPTEYLKLLGRVLRGYTPKPALLSEYPKKDQMIVLKLAQQKIKDSMCLWISAHKI